MIIMIVYGQPDRPLMVRFSGIHPYFVNMCFIAAICLIDCYRDPVTFCLRKSNDILPLDIPGNRLFRHLFVPLPECYGVVSDEFRRYSDPLLCLSLAGQCDLDRVVEVRIEGQMHFGDRLFLRQLQAERLSSCSALTGDPQVPMSILISGDAVDHVPERSLPVRRLR